MRVIQKILFTFALVAGLSFAAFAQKDDKKPTPPKPQPPVVNPQPKNPPPKESEKPKKPGGSMAIWKNEAGETA
ncbi:MAG TPA: hypothetical protein PLP21_08570 [Pyrinomonadaceae bacterium]|nr:hypothetical protein [Acidobacteriota bacterium]HQZ96359.1 hypothetical protein [Pyrinomonadaceae bacterium]